jgi:hypothetical protein
MPETGHGFFGLRKLTTAGLSHPLLLSLPVVLLLCRQPKKPFKNLPREACIESDG